MARAAPEGPVPGDGGLLAVNLRTTDGERRIAALSKNYRKQLEEWYAKGFEVVSARVAYILAWKGKDEPEDAEETAVMLPELVLRQ